MEKEIIIAGISGSLRKGSYNTLLLKTAMELAPEGMQINMVSFADVPLYNGDIDTPDVPTRPASVEKFRAELAKADGILFVSPEYNYTIPGGLKNAIDWASRGNDSPLIGKPVSLMGATMGAWGTVRMHINFQTLFFYFNMQPVYKPEVLIAEAHKKFDANGKLTDEKARELISKNLETLKTLILQNRR